METKKTILMVTAACMIFLGCAYDLILIPGGSKKKSETPKVTNQTSPKNTRGKRINYNTTGFQNPIILTRMDIKKKKAYIHNVKETLKLFRLIVGDTRTRGKTLSIDELSREAHKYMEVYVKPLINDSEANENSEIKIETAKLYLLCAFLYFDIAGYNKVTQYLKLIHTRYGKDSYLRRMRIDQKDIGFATLAEGVMELQKRMPVLIEKQ
ncbi:MAG: hypothetical protein KKH68_03755 [Proteobacteria bacterium]|nr:hypothetical protein [Pseudomonadota bacterium]